MSTPPSAARVEQLTQQLYALLPAHVRNIDAQQGQQMQALVKVLASGSGEVDVELDALYDALFIETAPEAALDDLAALVAAPQLQRLPPEAGQNARAFIANTIRYRRGKGTARVLEELARDVTGCGAVVVEYYQRLTRLQDLLDVRAERPSTARLVPGDTAARVATGFDRLPRLLDVRSIARTGGRHHVPHVGVHLLRVMVPSFASPPGTGLTSTLLAGVPVARPWPGGAGSNPGYFQLAAQPGRPLRLFNPDRRSAELDERAQPVDLPDRLHRLPLHLETEELRRAALEQREPRIAQPAWFDEGGQPFSIFLRKVGETTFSRVPPAEVQIANLDVLPPSGGRPPPSKSYTWTEAGTGGAPALPRTGSSPIRCGFDPATGRLIVAALNGGIETAEVRVAYGYGVSQPMGAGAHDRNDGSVPFDLTDTADVRHFIRIVDPAGPVAGPVNVRTVTSLSMALAEWAASGGGYRGVIVLTCCDRESAAPFVIQVHPGSELHIVSAQWRPKRVGPGIQDVPERKGFVVRRDRRFTIDGPVVVQTSGGGGGLPPGVLVLDGVELTSGLSLAAKAVSRLWLRHCTLRKPNGLAVSTAAPLEGAEIRIDHCLSGALSLDGGGGNGSLELQSSIVASDGFAGPALQAAELDAQLRNTTLLGAASVKCLEATNVIFDGALDVKRTQAGCVRFSWVPDGSPTPRRYRCQPDLAIAAAALASAAPLSDEQRSGVALSVTPRFLDSSLDEPTLGLLHPRCSSAIQQGGEHDTQMGAFAANGEAIRRANLVSLFDDYLPFGLEAGVIEHTSSSAVATRRNKP